MNAGKNVTSIAHGTEIFGQIKTDHDLVIQGAVVGDIETTGDVDLDGYVKGDIKAGTADIDNAELRGNLTVDGKTQIGGNAAIFGDVACADLDISGSVKGNIISKGLCTVQDGAIIAGNLSTYNAQIAAGAIVQGNLVHLTKQDDENDMEVDAFFNQFTEDGSFIAAVSEAWAEKEDSSPEPSREERASLLSSLTDRVEETEAEIDEAEKEAEEAFAKEFEADNNTE